MTQVQVKGLSDLQRFLDQLPAKMEANVMRSALRAGAQVIAEEAKARVPVDTGRLRESIRVSTRSRRGKVYAIVRAGARGKKVVKQSEGGRFRVVYDTAFYAAWVEYGTAAHRITARNAKTLVLRGGRAVKSVEHPGAKPRPFMRPALDSKAQQALLMVGNAIKRRLQSKHGLDTSGVTLEAP